MSILHIPANPAMNGQARLTMNVVFSEATGTALSCAILSPWNETPEKPYPAIVFVQGSAWQFPDIGYEIPQLSRYARAGYVVMTVTHRNCLEGHPFPAFLEDVKTAVRFLRANAEKYHVDPERIAVWGTSSGGNTSMLVSMTGDDPRYNTGEYGGYSDAVRCAVQCFGPTDILTLFEYHFSGGNSDRTLANALAGERPYEEVAQEMSPYRIAEKGKNYPPILMIQGNADPVVPWDQAEMMYGKYQEVGADAQLICIDGAPHEGPFWSDAVHDQIMAFFKKNL
ncbi:MAG: alpha/beta hydrolase [Clostridia bacterium]|nr:alpha/beta hydrolase [Clostridia bacterium]